MEGGDEKRMKRREKGIKKREKRGGKEGWNEGRRGREKDGINEKYQEKVEE